MDTNTKFIQLPEPKHSNFHCWTPEEKVFKRKNRILSEIQDFNITLKSVLIYKLRKSVFGGFLKELNIAQHQDDFLNDNKMMILSWQLKRYNKHDLDITEERNKILDNYYALITEAVTCCNLIDMAFLEEKIQNLHLESCFIKSLDFTLRSFHNLQALILCGNYIKDISGSILPRNLQFLELFDNLISDMSSLVQHIPKTLLHLGLGRNALSDGGQLHLLGSCENLRFLLSLDLSDNDICKLDNELNSFTRLKSLKSLSLEGNPCWVIPLYKTRILKMFPYLLYLDETEILDTDRADYSEELCSPGLIFYSYRILGLPEPPKDIKNKQTIHLEINFPLLIETPSEPEEPDIIEDDLEIKEKEKEIKGKKSEKKSKNSASEKQPTEKKGHKKYYSGPDEYNSKSEKQNKWFKTEARPWARVIDFPPLTIEAPQCNLTLIRDCFRSLVPVRLIYQKIAPIGTKSKSKSNKTKKKAKIPSKQTIDIPEQPKLETEQAEVILKRITLASFYCELKSVNWSDTSLDFYWIDHPDIGDKAIRVNGSLQALDYNLTYDLKDKTIKQSNNNDAGSDIIRRLTLPKILTCQIGFGLNRN